MKLLIAVKSGILSKLLASSLAMYTVHTCDTGADALAMLEMHRPDALILDLTLPGIDGLTVLQKSGYKPRSILALTNLATPDVLAEAAAAGIQDILLIPCTIRHITEHLDALTGNPPSAEG